MAVKRYDGSAWQTVAGLGAQGAAATSSSIATWVKTASGGETSVSGNDDNSQPLSYTVGQELVFINGVLQKRGADYTATTGNSITGLTALTSGDIVSVWTVNAFSVTNAISNTIMDAKGDLLTASGADVPARLAVGSNDTVLTADSSTATGLKWATPSSGPTGWALKNSGSTSITGVSTVTFSGLSSKRYLILLENVSTATAASDIWIRFNSDSAQNYSQFGGVILNRDPWARSNVSNISSYSTATRIIAARTSLNGYVGGATFVDLADSTGWKNFINTGSGYDNISDGADGYYTQGFYEASAAITSITITNSGGYNFDGSSVCYILGAD